MPHATHVLLVEDDPSDAQLLLRAVEHEELPLAMSRLKNGEEAIAYLRSIPKHFPALLLLDLKMPRLSGFEVLQWLRSCDGALKCLPVLVLTSSDDPRDIKRAYEVGANAYVAKPHTPAEYRTMVNAVHDYWLVWNESASPDA